LDQAVERFLKENLELRAMRDEVLMAQADIEAAGQPPQAYRLITVGTNGIKTWHIQPRSPILKPWIQILVARTIERAREAQYQDAVRLRVDELYTAYLDVDEAQVWERYGKAALQGSERLLQFTRDMQKSGIISQGDGMRVHTEHEIAALKVAETATALRKARLVLASMLGLPDATVDQLRLHDDQADSNTAPPDAPPTEELLRSAVIHRPDLRAHRLGLLRALLDWLKALIEPLDQIRLDLWPDRPDLVRPGHDGNAAPRGISAVVTLPTAVRNRAMLKRATINVRQTKTELARVERQVGLDVRTASFDYRQARSAARSRREALDHARTLRDSEFKQYQKGEVSSATFLEAQRKYNDVLTLYLKETIRLGRSKLLLKTAVGEPIWR
jgi:cobalt-zinc-cadmium efflux system outer membrane protein